MLVLEFWVRARVRVKVRARVRDFKGYETYEKVMVRNVWNPPLLSFLPSLPLPIPYPFLFLVLPFPDCSPSLFPAVLHPPCCEGPRKFS